MMTIADARSALRAGDVSATELLEAAIDVADETDETLGIYIRRFDAEARSAASRVDDAFTSGVTLGSLAGIPLGIKDNISAVEGATTAQSLVLDPGWGKRAGDAVAVRRIREAGAVITGKLSTMEFAIGLPDSSKPFPIPRNGWDPRYWAGGSSSGSGSGVSVGAVLGALGTDTGGSIRVPAAFCGITGLKPTFGRIPTTGTVPLGFTVDSVGPMARTARDCAILLNVLAGADSTDAMTSADPVDDYEKGLRGDLSGLTIGVDRLIGRASVRDQEIDQRIDAAIKVFERLGATIEEIELPMWDELHAALYIVTRSEAAAYHAQGLRMRWSDFGYDTRTNIAAGFGFSGADYVQAQRVRRVGQRKVADLFHSVDLVLTPTTSVVGLRVEDLTPDRLRGSFFTRYWNATGNPVIAVPIGFSEALGEPRLPVSMQIIGPPFAEACILRAADRYQSETNWHLMSPAATRSAG